MKITRVEPILVALAVRPWRPEADAGDRSLGDDGHALRCVDTDQGIVGWGDAFGFAVSPVTARR